MKRIVFYSIMFVIAFIIGCKNDESPTTPGGQDSTTRIRVSTTDLHVYADSTKDHFIISNRSRQSIRFQITESPTWLELDHTSGVVEFFPDTVKISINSNGMEEKIYTGTIKITSDGGDADIQVTFNNTPPEFRVWLPLLTMSRDYSQTEVELHNDGGKTISWNVASQPSWILLPQQSGIVYASPYLLEVSVDISRLAYGQYEGDILFQSNAGDAVVTVKMTYERQIEVFPGSGAAKLQIGQNFATMVATYGEPESTELVKLPDKYIQLIARYNAKGFLLTFEPGTLMLKTYDAKKIDCIYLSQPYDGLTESNIGIGSEYSDVLAAYGEPQETITDMNVVIYDTGIAFYLDSGMSKVTGMSVFTDRAAFKP